MCLKMTRHALRHLFYVLMFGRGSGGYVLAGSTLVLCPSPNATFQVEKENTCTPKSDIPCQTKPPVRQDLLYSRRSTTNPRRRTAGKE